MLALCPCLHYRDHTGEGTEQLGVLLLVAGPNAGEVALAAV